jgi:NTP pyrophosphatase (non-canonical NTP hydrolase)
MAHAELTLSLDPVMTLMLTKQREFQTRILGGVEPSDLSDADKMAYIREQALALMDEVHEAMAETGWKSWATSNHINREAFKGELADVFIFFMSLMLVADIPAHELCQAILAKQIKNIKRQDDGYDGISTKCPGCKRAYDDDAVKCKPRGETEFTKETGNPSPPYCDQVNAYVAESDGRHLSVTS